MHKYEQNVKIYIFSRNKAKTADLKWFFKNELILRNTDKHLDKFIIYYTLMS